MMLIGHGASPVAIALGAVLRGFEPTAQPGDEMAVPGIRRGAGGLYRRFAAQHQALGFETNHRRVLLPSYRSAA